MLELWLPALVYTRYGHARKDSMPLVQTKKYILYCVEMFFCVYRNHIECAYNNCGCLPPVCITHIAQHYNMHNNCHCWIKWFFFFIVCGIPARMKRERVVWKLFHYRERESERGNTNRLTRYLTRKTIFPLDLGHSNQNHIFTLKMVIWPHTRSTGVLEAIHSFCLCPAIYRAAAQQQTCDVQKNTLANHIIYKIQKLTSSSGYIIRTMLTEKCECV